ncbi:probable receptor-like protein kinase At1g49730 isoform X1 [Phoenix dactylifera]|uniref:Probable receptor-like protein kinase At1g49730 isoform X1 n=1 Tax=Phoenix dactylifera TaxID=42345 RepID=A0A8B7BMB0_PHODC|nr:probable receptor-like protein kinase At1g49730 isoform X1 [Phoenix dactylifera]
MPAFVLGFLVAAVALLHSRFLLVTAGDCPLDLSWSNFTSIASTCSSQNERSKCCRYINALVAVSVAQYANTTGDLGVPSALSDICINSVFETLNSNGIPRNATMFCGLGPKIPVSFRCEERGTVLEMLQSPNFDDVVRNCKMPLSLESRCKKCLNSGISYLRHLIGAQDNVTLNICRDATFVALANQGDNFLAADVASCFFSVQGLSILRENSSESSLQSPAPATSPSPSSAQAPAPQLIGMPLKKHHHTYQLGLIPGIGIMITGLASLLLIILILLICKKSRQLKRMETHTENLWNASSSSHFWKFQEGASTMFHRFSYKETRKATGNFSTIIGRGVFGIIYKAQYDDGSIFAVKRINNISEQGEVEFCREMELLGRLHHRHLVALKGFCFARCERFLMYEFMENGSLRDHLHSSERTLAWQTRIQVAVDVANALEYLHFYCDPPLCHGDIKSSNVLLDKNFLAKVADFGLMHSSRSGAIGVVPVNTNTRGSPGYMDPEYLVTQELTEKSDVYSYGVLLLELVTGKLAIHDNRNLVEWSQEFMAADCRLPELVDPAIADQFDLEQLQVVVAVIQWCTQREGRARPSIKQVLRMFYERLDPVHIGFAQAVEDEKYYHNGGRTRKLKAHQTEMVAYSGDARCLQSSSSTSRSYCSRSFLLEGGSPQSPPGSFSV